MYRRIAVAIDTPAEAERVVNFAASLLGPGDGRLDLVHIHEPVRPGDELEALPIYGWEQIVEYDDRIDAESLAEETEKLRDTAARLRSERGMTAEVHVVRGDPAETLPRYVRSSVPDLIVAATRPHRTHHGSTSGTLVRRSGVPVLLLRSWPAPHSDDIRRILVALDGSATGAMIVPPVVQMARATGADVYLLRVAGDPLSSLLHLAPRSTEEGYLASLRAMFPADVRPPEIGYALNTDPAGAILRESPAFDLVAMTTHGWGGAREWVLRSTAAQVLDSSRLPLLAFHPAPVTAQPMPGVAAST